MIFNIMDAHLSRSFFGPTFQIYSFLPPSLPPHLHPSPLCSEIPRELLSAARGGEVDINIQDKRTESYTKPKPKLVAFSGHGHKLGRCVMTTFILERIDIQGIFFSLCFSYAPEVVSHSSPSPAATTGGVAGSSVDLAPPTVPLDPTQPTTSVQIRLADGTRLVSKFNHTHTVNDIRQFINLYPEKN